MKILGWSGSRRYNLPIDVQPISGRGSGIGIRECRRREWQGNVRVSIVTVTVPDIEILALSSTSTVVSSISQESPMIAEQSSISGYSVSSPRHLILTIETSGVAIVPWRVMALCNEWTISMN